jgi:hypothetical protein
MKRASVCIADAVSPPQTTDEIPKKAEVSTMIDRIQLYLGAALPDTVKSSPHFEEHLIEASVCLPFERSKRRSISISVTTIP